MLLLVYKHFLLKSFYKATIKFIKMLSKIGIFLTFTYNWVNSYNMNKSYFLFLLLMGFNLTSCGRDKVDAYFIPYTLERLKEKARGKFIALTSKEEAFVRERCKHPNHNFHENEDIDSLYSKDCIDGMRLTVKTAAKGQKIDTSLAIGKIGVTLEGELNFINDVYKTTYEIQNTGDLLVYHFLRSLLPGNENFFGSLKATYDIVFVIDGNSLILYKSSQEEKYIPYNERTSQEIVHVDGKAEYRVPFLRYSIQYCDAKIMTRDREQTKEHKKDCRATDFKNAYYIEINKSSKDDYEYAREKNLFPSKYFEGQWFFTEGPVQTFSSFQPGHDNELPPSSAHLIEFDRTANSLELKNVSGGKDVAPEDRATMGSIHISWHNYQMDREGDIIKSPFRETHSNLNNPIESPYIVFKKPKDIKIPLLEPKETETGVQYNETINLTDDNSSMEHIHIAKDYLSMTLKIKIPFNDVEQTFTHRYSFYKRTSVIETGFIERRWFERDHDQYFGITPTIPQTTRTIGDPTSEEVLKKIRMIRFNTKKPSNDQSTIKWYFSKNSTREEPYRTIAKEAIDIYNWAFHLITDDKIKVELEERQEQEKDLGDPRWNIINLSTKGSYGGDSLFGFSPTFVNPDTGQIIGTTANIFLDNILDESHALVRNYVKYEIFQKNKKSQEQEKEDAIHVASEYLRSKIEKECELQEHIKTQKRKFNRGQITPMDNLNDREKILFCAKTISKNQILALILHEMGHSFGLSHNFKASIDTTNYYDSIEEMQKYFPNAKFLEEKVPKTSSVMDYMPRFLFPAMTILGKYDLAVLRFLYMDQIEIAGHSETEFLPPFLALSIPKNTKEQNQLSDEILNKRKVYLHCSDSKEQSNQGENFLCKKFDHGSKPKEAILFFIDRIKQFFNIYRYRYDNPQGLTPFNIFLSRFAVLYSKIEGFYKHWIKLRNDQLEGTNDLQYTRYRIPENPNEDDERIARYKEIIQERDKEGTEYSDFYSLRNSFYDFAIDFLFLETMKCEVCETEEVIFYNASKCKTGGQKYFIDLELIKQYYTSLTSKEFQKPIVDCYSPLIKNFLKDELSLKLIGQKGKEDFLSYYPVEKSEAKQDIFPISVIFDTMFVPPKIKGTEETAPPLLYFLLQNVALEPDLFNNFRIKLEHYILEREDLSERDFSKVIGLYFVLAVIIQSPPFQQDQEIFIHNQAYFDSVKYSTDDTLLTESFRNTVETPLKEKTLLPENLNPFLQKTYTEYLCLNESFLPEHCEDIELSDEARKNLKGQDFQAYLISLDNTIHEPGPENTLIIPYQANNFASKMMGKYNENLKRINKLTNQDQLTFLEEIDRNKREDENKLLLFIIKALDREKLR